MGKVSSKKNVKEGEYVTKYLYMICDKNEIYDNLENIKNCTNNLEMQRLK